MVTNFENITYELTEEEISERLLTISGSRKRRPNASNSTNSKSSRPKSGEEYRGKDKRSGAVDTV